MGGSRTVRGASRRGADFPRRRRHCATTGRGRSVADRADGRWNWKHWFVTAVLAPILVATLLATIPGVAGDVVDYLKDLPIKEDERIYNEVRDNYAECYAPEVDLSIDDLYDDGEPRKIGDVLIDSSKELSRLANFVKGSSSQWHGSRMVFLYGAAGSGKSSVVNRLRENSNSAFFHVGDFFRGGVHEDSVMEEQLNMETL